jgi:hypothetical protein
MTVCTERHVSPKRCHSSSAFEVHLLPLGGFSLLGSPLATAHGVATLPGVHNWWVINMNVTILHLKTCAAHYKLITFWDTIMKAYQLAVQFPFVILNTAHTDTKNQSPLSTYILGYGMIRNRENCIP